MSLNLKRHYTIFRILGRLLIHFEALDMVVSFLGVFVYRATGKGFEYAMMRVHTMLSGLERLLIDLTDHIFTKNSEAVVREEFLGSSKLEVQSSKDWWRRRLTCTGRQCSML